MYDLGYDPESVIQDADIEMMELKTSAAEHEALRKSGLCPHDSYKPLYPGDFDGTWVCNDCGKMFASEQALIEDAEDNVGSLYRH